MLTLLFALGVVAFMVRGATPASRAWSPGASPPTDEPVCDEAPTMPRPRSSAPSAWRAYFASGGCVEAPSAVPADASDVASVGDVDRLEVDGDLGARGVYEALYLEEDPAELLMLADRVEESGFMFAANRLRKKAFRNIV